MSKKQTAVECWYPVHLLTMENIMHILFPVLTIIQELETTEEDVMVADTLALAEDIKDKGYTSAADIQEYINLKSNDTSRKTS